jgi:hypothetical protein
VALSWRSSKKLKKKKLLFFFFFFGTCLHKGGGREGFNLVTFAFYEA